MNQTWPGENPAGVDERSPSVAELRHTDVAVVEDREVPPAPTRPPGAPSRRVGRSTGAAVRWVGRLSPLLLGGIAGFYGVEQTRLSHVNGLGLIAALPPIYEVGVVLVGWGFLLNLGRDRGRRAVLAVHLATLIMLLDGLPGLAEPNPRFATAWLHVGFIQYLAGGNGLLLRLDARFSWAGLFSGGAILQRASGTSSLLWLVKFYPVAFAAFACWAIWVIGRTLRFTVVQRELGLLVFVVANWSAQDYFSPQATAFCLYFTMAAVVLTVFMAPGIRSGTRRDRWLRPERLPVVDALNRRQQYAVYLAIVVVLFAVVITHQLTPGIIAIAFLLLAMTNSTRIRALPFISGLLTVTWLGYAAEAYWSGHLTKLTSGIGSLGKAVQANVGRRATGGTLDRTIVVFTRVGLAGAAWVLVIVAAVVLWKRRRTPVAALCLFGAGFPLLVLQPYGGEMLIRVFLFSLPAAALLIATLVVPNHVTRRLAKRAQRGPTRFGGRRAIAGAALVVAVPAFVIARFGNESYERITTDDRTVVDVLYRIAPVDSVVYVADRQALIDSQRVGQVKFDNLNSFVNANSFDPHAIEVQLRGAASTNLATYVLLTESEQAYGRQVYGLPKDWGPQLVHSLIASGTCKMQYQLGQSYLLRVVVPMSQPGVPPGLRVR